MKNRRYFQLSQILRQLEKKRVRIQLSQNLRQLLQMAEFIKLAIYWF